MVKDAHQVKAAIVDCRVHLTTPNTVYPRPGQSVYSRMSGGSSIGSSVFSTGSRSSGSSGRSSLHSTASKSSGSSACSAITVVQVPGQIEEVHPARDIRFDVKDLVIPETSKDLSKTQLSTLTEEKNEAPAPSPIIAGTIDQSADYVPKAKRRILVDQPKASGNVTWSSFDAGHYHLEGTKKEKPAACSSVVESSGISGVTDQAVKGMDRNYSFVHQHLLKLQSPESRLIPGTDTNQPRLESTRVSMLGESSVAPFLHHPRSLMLYNNSVINQDDDLPGLGSQSGLAGQSSRNTASRNTAESSSAITQITNDTTANVTSVKCGMFCRMSNRRKSLPILERNIRCTRHQYPDRLC